MFDCVIQSNRHFCQRTFAHWVLRRSSIISRLKPGNLGSLAFLLLALGGGTEGGGWTLESVQWLVGAWDFSPKLVTGWVVVEYYELQKGGIAMSSV